MDIETGELIYTNKKEEIVVLILLVFFIGWIAFCEWLEGPSLFYVPITLLFGIPLISIYFLYLIIKDKASEFYENGVVLYQQRKMLGIIPYSEFDSFKCYSFKRRVQRGYAIYYCIGFFENDREITTLTTNNLKEIKEIWRKLSTKNPHLRENLILAPPDIKIHYDKIESEGLLELLSSQQFVETKKSF